MEVGKSHEAEAVRWMELLAEEIATCITHLSQMEEVGCREKGLYILFCDLNCPCVDEADEQLHSQLVDLFEGDYFLASF